MQSALATPPTTRDPVVVISRTSSRDPAQQLARQGWYNARGFFDRDAVQSLRCEVTDAFNAPQHADKIIKPPGCGGILPDLFLFPGIYRRLFQPRTAALLNELIGPGFVLLPEHAVHRDGFGGWHKDTDMFEYAGSMAHWSTDHAIYQCAVYLQDNTAEHGGGLSVVNGSHLVPKPGAGQPGAAQRFQDRAQQQGTVLGAQAGDLVVFHTRLDHRATPTAGIAPYGSKLALFFIAARDNHHAVAYSEFIHRRTDYTYLRTYRVPPEMQSLAREQGFRFAD